MTGRVKGVKPLGKQKNKKVRDQTAYSKDMMTGKGKGLKPLGKQKQKRKGIRQYCYRIIRQKVITKIIIRKRTPGKKMILTKSVHHNDIIDNLHQKSNEMTMPLQKKYHCYLYSY